jgi:hypothetical protein
MIACPFDGRYSGMVITAARAGRDTRIKKRHRVRCLFSNACENYQGASRLPTDFG